MGDEGKFVSVGVSKWRVKLKEVRTPQTMCGAPELRNAGEIAEIVENLIQQTKLEMKPTFLQSLELKELQ